MIQSIETKIAEKFNTSFEKDIPQSPTEVVPKPQTELSEVKQETGVLANTIAALPCVTLEDKDFINGNIKKLIERCNKILDLIDKDLDVSNVTNGAPSPVKPYERIGFYNSYSTMSNAIAIQIRELLELNKTVANMAIANQSAMAEQLEKQQAEKEENEKNKKVTLTAAELCSIIKEAREKSKLNAVEAKFNIVEEINLRKKNEED